MNSDVDVLLDLLKAERRRIVLELLHEIQCEYDSDEVTVQVPDLIRQVAAIEAAVDSATVGRTVQRSPKVDLHHTHLPMLDDYGVIEYDTVASEVSTTDRTRPVAQAMRSIVDTVEDAEIGLVQSPGIDS